ncbi:ImmA/IrrE family metallo-endopeptidase [Amycolatopsis sp. NPDC051128]|uniref:ImmA/IrrE family metallo-endopeptidase n=1 Tax=Amycolatopsis sp. NPDC051128 TaxID=3155412 RepID=UPI0034479EE4
MNDIPQPIIRQLRSLMPVRPLEEHEARGVAERQATKLLELLDQHEPAVDVELVGELPRVQVKVDSALSGTGILGFSDWSRGRWLIVVNRDDSPTRRRFTLGHEFKHVLDHPYIKVIYSELGRTNKERDEITERICNYFAACVLMPRNWVKRAWASGIQGPAALAAKFKVSPEAMAIRLREIGLVDPWPRSIHLPEPRRSVRSYFRKDRPAMRPLVSPITT